MNAETAAIIAEKGIDGLLDYGIAVTVLVLFAVVAGGLIYKLVTNIMQKCEKRFEDSLASHRNMVEEHKTLTEDVTEKMTGVINKNTEAWSRFSEIMRHMK